MKQDLVGLEDHLKIIEEQNKELEQELNSIA